MILVDVNLLVYTINQDDPFHPRAKVWWESELRAGTSIALSWNSLYGFLRIVTSHKAVTQPLPLADALQVVKDWLELPQVLILQQTDSHFTHFRTLLSGPTCTPKLISDAHLAALAIEHNCELNSADHDFAKFPGLRWRNPLTQSSTAASP